MAADEALARALQDGSGLPTVRLYGWTPWAISLGHHQEESDINHAQCRKDGIDVVRRPTGGRAILHAQELTYCVVMPAGRRSVLDVYNDISQALVRGLKLFGVEASLQKSQPDFLSAYKEKSSIPCFTSSARYEIEVDGRKLVGSAQRRFHDDEHDVVLQHGSILCGPAHKQLSRYLQIDDAALLDRIGTQMDAKTTDLQEITGKTVDPAELAPCIRQGFAEAWGLVPSSSTAPLTTMTLL